MTNSQNIQSLDVTDYSTTVMYLLTQEDSRVAGMVSRVETAPASTHTFERISGNLQLTAKTRNVSTDDVSQDPTWDRRQVNIATSHMATFHEYDDLYTILVNPQPYYTRKHVETINRRKDDIVYQAAIGNATQLNTDANGAVTTAQVALPASQRIDKDVGGTDSGLNTAKLTAARELNLVNENMDRMTCFLHGNDYGSLLREQRAIDGDFISGNPISTGTLGDLLGFDFVVYNHINGAGTSADPRLVLLMDSEAVAVATGPEQVKMKADVRPDRSYKYQLYTALTMAAVRLEETRVIVIETVDPTP